MILAPTPLSKKLYPIRLGYIEQKAKDASFEHLNIIIAIFVEIKSNHVTFRTWILDDHQHGIIRTSFFKYGETLNTMLVQGSQHKREMED